MTADSLLDRLNRDGFVVIPSAIPPPQVAALRSAAQHSAAHARAGNWPHVRTLPKQFPPWPVSGPNPAAPGIWGVQGLLHPDMPGREAYTSLYFSDAILAPTRELLGCEDDALVMELCNLLVRPDRDFELRWHRDDVPDSATADEEVARLLGSGPARSAQWNLALYDDESLVVVPGSHRRARTDEERAAGPYEPVLPGQVVVRLAAGDAVFYNNNILHRGVYDSGRERMTVHGSAGHVDGAAERARNVLQHGCRDWIDRCDFGFLDEGTRAKAEKMRERLIRMGREHGDVGYSLEG
ncbi:phytanoyl-CoA dioxygenase [Phialemonium atrogriseum]|uniref:Phytanoyl-CoA dioxygenase n=1 Tax=Phialemonium atrogriseum TaxID=1093897 RepID=A0AAJ0FJJ1_9PEZI|nr:phytanoyl-CoA dioxygenase [Phialemonium atrogriseum]KAK1765418.1 phytanoyl-CoA dioxygenase [Phialemonium atrogriseum]